MNLKRTFIIGDVHGMLDALKALLAHLSPQTGDTLIFVGDLVDKGPDPAGVVRHVRTLAESADYDVVLVEGNHEDRHRRYRRNLVERPTIAAEQAAAAPELAALTQALDAQDIAFLDAAAPFHRVTGTDILVVHGGIPGDMNAFPATLEDAAALTGQARRDFQRIFRTRYVEQSSGRYLVLGRERDGDPFWAEIYDGRFGHVVFGHQPFMDGPARFAHATGVDTGAVHGGQLTAMIVDAAGERAFVSLPCEKHAERQRQDQPVSSPPAT